MLPATEPVLCCLWVALAQGKHTDRLLTISYLPVNLAVIATMVHMHSRVRPRLRIVGGLLGFTLAISAVPLVSSLASLGRCSTSAALPGCCPTTAVYAS